ncbi:MAG: hypothetical protein GXO00_02770 [Candidatus Diapherotrites archaeon]|nr:hypothetical protein [Candidatus Diapherotrites archaeon]
MILITSSRKPGRITRSFCKDLQRALPGSKYFNRGKGSIADIVDLAYRQGFQRVLIVGETKGNPSLIRSIIVGKNPRWDVQLYISGVKLCRELGCGKNDGDYVKVEGEVYGDVLQRIFGYPVEEGEPVILKEEKTMVRFLFEGENVGPSFRVRGWDEVPQRLKQQSSLKT